MGMYTCNVFLGRAPRDPVTHNVKTQPHPRNMNEAIVLLLPGIVLGVELSSASRLAACHNINK